METKQTIRDFKQLSEQEYAFRYENGQEGRLSFYNDHIVRIHVDPSGAFPETPEPSDPERPAHIVNPKFAIDESLKVKADDDDQMARLTTEALSLELDKARGTFVLKNAEGKTVLEESEPLKVTDNQATQTLKSHPESQYFGGGTQNGRFTHKGQKINIANENNWTDGGVASPAPLYWSTDGYGVLRNTFKPGMYDFEKEDPQTVTTTHNDGRFDAFYFVADAPKDIIKSYYEVTGDPVVLPEFAHYEGHLNAYNRDYWIPVDEGTPNAIHFPETDGWFLEVNPDELSKMPDEEKQAFLQKAVHESLNAEKGDKVYPFTARALVERYHDQDIPLGWVVVNDGYGAGYGQEDTLEGNIQNLANFSQWAKDNYNVETGLWTQSDLKPVPGVAPLLQRDLASEVKDAGVRVLKTDVAWVGPGYSFGLNGTEEAKQVIAESGDDARPFIITLDGWGGTQRNGGIWTGDQTGGDWEYIRFHIPTYIGTGLSGQPNIGSDADGIFGGGNPIVNTRDYQWKTFTLLQLNMDGWGRNPKNPFAFDQTTTDLNRAYLKLKSTLVPYAYSIHHEATEGLPPIRATFLEFPDEAINYTKDVQYQYLYGPSFLVAPIYQDTQSDADGNDVRDGIVLPGGEDERWIDFFTGEVYAGGQVLNHFDAPLWKLPVFVRQGAIIPRNRANNNVSEIKRDERIIDFYPAGETEFTLVEDDGRTNAYQRGEKAGTLIESKADTDGNVTLTVNPTVGDYQGFEKQKSLQFNVNITEKPESLTLTLGDEDVALTEVDSLEAFENDENVYFYDEAPELNTYQTEGSRYYGQKLVKNPLLRVKTAKYDVTKAAARLSLTGYHY